MEFVTSDDPEANGSSRRLWPQEGFHWLLYRPTLTLDILAGAILPQIVTWQEWTEFVNVGRFSNQWKLSRTFASALQHGGRSPRPHCNRSLFLFFFIEDKHTTVWIYLIK